MWKQIKWYIKFSHGEMLQTRIQCITYLEWLCPHLVNPDRPTSEVLVTGSTAGYLVWIILVILHFISSRIPAADVKVMVCALSWVMLFKGDDGIYDVDTDANSPYCVSWNLGCVESNNLMKEISQFADLNKMPIWQLIALTCLSLFY